MTLFPISSPQVLHSTSLCKKNLRSTSIMDQSISGNNSPQGNPFQRSVSTQTPDWTQQVTVMEAPTVQEREVALALCQMSRRPIVFPESNLRADRNPHGRPWEAPSPPIPARSLPPYLEPQAQSQRTWEMPPSTPPVLSLPASPESQVQAQRVLPSPIGGWIRPRPADHGIGQAFATMMAQVHSGPQQRNFDATTPETQRLTSILRGTQGGFALNRPGYAREESFMPEVRAPQTFQQANQRPYTVGNSMHNVSRVDIVPTDLFADREVETQQPQARFRSSFPNAFPNAFFNTPPAQSYQTPYPAFPPVRPAPPPAPKKRTPLPDCPLRCKKCEKKFTCMADLQKHQGLSEDCSKVHMCSHCDKTFTGGRWLLTRHLRTTHADQQCPYCPQKYLKPSGRDDHIRKKHSKCHICAEFFPRTDDIVGHLRSVHGLTLSKARSSANREWPAQDPDETEDDDEDED